MPVVELASSDPFENLATETLLLNRVDQTGPLMLLWHNQPSVILGRHQNPWVECNLMAMKRDGIILARRISGGGTVYHDPGNINFSFLLRQEAYDQERQFGVILRALNGLGIPAYKNQRNDLCVGTRKFSGNAFRHSRGNSLHHGTLLLNADIGALTAYLAAPEAGIETKAIQSVRSQVINLEESRPGLTPQEVISALVSGFLVEYGTSDWSEQHVKISGASEAERPPWWPGRTEVSAQKQELADWEWLFAHTPPFRRRYRGPDGTVVLSVKKGIISEVLPEAFGDGSHPAKTEWQTFAGVALKRVDVEGIATEPGTDWLKTAILKDLW